MIYQENLVNSEKRLAENREVIRKLKRKKPKNLDQTFHELHDKAFQKVDCLQCANCCKTTSPLFSEADIDRLAKSLKMKRQQFIRQYLRVDEDGDHVFQSAPCPFLLSDNKCLVYHDRPKACREYPHTNRKRMHQILDLTLKNSLICPAVAQIFDQLDQR